MASGTGRSARERAQLAQQAQQQAERRRQRRILALVAIGFVVVVLVAGIGVQAYRSHRAPSAGDAVPAGAGADFAPVTVTNSRPLLLGKQGAPVTVELFEDFHCPHCADFEEKFGPTVRDLQNQGKITVALYPMAFIDAGSSAAANAMACAAEAGFGQSYYYGLFANHTLQWSDDQLLTLADKVGTPSASFRNCVTGKTHQGWVDSIDQTAVAKGVTGTPTLFVAGQKLPVETLTVEQFAAAVDRAAGDAN